MKQTTIKDMNDKNIVILGQKSSDPIHRNGDKKPIIKAKAPQNINKSQFQYLD
ncbi:hypothetical protein QI259_02495 [Staphylococcus saprophyticus]|nr:hypothetical protein [Staphylococcus saprophyticus]